VARVAFLLLVGATFAMYPLRSTRARARRVALIAAHAALVSAASWYLVPRAWIRLGVLHCTALCTLALTAMDHARLLGPTRTVLAAGLCLAAYHAAPVTHTALDLVTGAGARVTMLDWFPPLHWMPVVLGGHSLGAAARALRVRPFLKLKLKLTLKPKPSFLSWVGRRSLELYTAQMLVLLVARARFAW
jgi:uncharacterized membrane protein